MRFSWAKLVTGRMPGTIGTAIPAAAARSRKSQEQIDVEEELGDRPVGAGVELVLQIVEVVPGALRLGMGLGIGGDADLEIGDPLQPGDEVGGKGVAARDAAHSARRWSSARLGGSPRSATMWRMPASQ